MNIKKNLVIRKFKLCIKQFLFEVQKKNPKGCKNKE